MDERLRTAAVKIQSPLYWQSSVPLVIWGHNIGKQFENMIGVAATTLRFQKCIGEMSEEEETVQPG